MACHAAFDGYSIRQSAHNSEQAGLTCKKMTFGYVQGVPDAAGDRALTHTEGD